MLSVDNEHTIALAETAPDDVKIHVWSKWNAKTASFTRQLEGLGATLFQSEVWLETWYETFATSSDIDTILIGLENRTTGELFMLLPLCRRIEDRLSIICFADWGLSDYNAPLVADDLQLDDAQINTLMQAVCKTLPDADLLKLEKLPATINQIDNPLCAINGVQESNLSHYGIEIAGSWEDYWSGLKRNFRKDQRRRWRVLEKRGEVSFIWAQDPEQALSLFETLIVQQHNRLHGLDLPYLLDNGKMKKFYQRLIRKACKNGPIIFTALLVDDQPVATLCGFGDGRRYAMTLSGYETGDWSKCSPGRLLTERTMQTLHENGYNYFDFTIGDEPYKKYFAKQQGPLQELYRPLGWKALPRVSWMKFKANQRHSRIASSLKKWLPGSL